MAVHSQEKPLEDNEVKPTATTHSGKDQSSASTAQEAQPHWPIGVGDVPSPCSWSWGPHRPPQPKGMSQMGTQGKYTSSKSTSASCSDGGEKKTIGSHVDKSKWGSHCGSGKSSPHRKDSGGAKGGLPHLEPVSRAPRLPASPGSRRTLSRVTKTPASTVPLPPSLHPAPCAPQDLERQQ